MKPLVQKVKEIIQIEIGIAIEIKKKRNPGHEQPTFTAFQSEEFDFKPDNDIGFEEIKSRQADALGAQSWRLWSLKVAYQR
ncbi:MAG: hypothetical protein PVG49_03930 [Desulfobacteraceae bacterium]